MSMDRSKVELIVQDAGQVMARAMCLGHWDITIEVTPLDGSRADVSISPSYEKAKVRFDPEEADDESDLLNSIRHELVHLIAADMELMRRWLKDVLCEDAWHAYHAQEDHASEKFVVHVERMLDFWGLTPRVLLKIGRGGRHTIRDLFDAAEDA